MKHPPITSVQIGEVTFTLRFPDGDAELEMLGDDYGRSLLRRQLIILAPDQGPDQLRDTITHEILHCIIASTALARINVDSEDAEEILVREITPGWVGVLRRNPELVTYLCA